MALLCLIGWLAASLASTQWIPVAPPSWPLRWHSKCLQTLTMSPRGWGEAQSPKLRTAVLEKSVAFIFSALSVHHGPFTPCLLYTAEASGLRSVPSPTCLIIESAVWTQNSTTSHSILSAGPRSLPSGLLKIHCKKMNWLHFFNEIAASMQYVSLILCFLPVFLTRMWAPPGEQGFCQACALL